jgi:hypothetical protein
MYVHLAGGGTLWPGLAYPASSVRMYVQMDKSLRFELRLSPEMKALFEREAATAGLGLAEWLRLAGLACVRTARYKESARSQGMVVESAETLPTIPTSSKLT